MSYLRLHHTSAVVTRNSSVPNEGQTPKVLRRPLSATDAKTY